MFLITEQCSPNPLTWRNAICCRNECSKKWTKLPLLLLSMDGFRAEYLLRDKTPSIQSLIDCGSHAPFIYPSYPSKTFPNHYTIATVRNCNHLSNMQIFGQCCFRACTLNLMVSSITQCTILL